MTSAEALLSTRLILHVLTALMLACYCRPAAKFRLGPSVMAGFLLSSSAGLAAQILLTWDVLVQRDLQPQFVLFVFTVFLPVAWARGDMAKIYDGLVKYSGSPWRSRS